MGDCCPLLRPYCVKNHRPAHPNIDVHLHSNTHAIVCLPFGVVVYQEVLLGLDDVEVEAHGGPVERQRPGVFVGDHVLGREIQVPFQLLQGVKSSQVRSGQVTSRHVTSGLGVIE